MIYRWETWSGQAYSHGFSAITKICGLVWSPKMLQRRPKWPTCAENHHLWSRLSFTQTGLWLQCLWQNEVQHEPRTSAWPSSGLLVRVASSWPPWMHPAGDAEHPVASCRAIKNALQGRHLYGSSHCNKLQVSLGISRSQRACYWPAT